MKTAVVTIAVVALFAGACGGGDRGTSPEASDTRTATAVPSGTSTSSAPGPSSTSPQTSTPGTPEAPTTTTTTTPTAAGPGRCHTSDLTASLKPQGVAAGNVYATLVLTNHTQRVCEIFGYGGVQLLDSRHLPIVTAQHRDPAHPPTAVIVKPNGHASSVLHWGQVPSGTEPVDRPCEPLPSFLSVIPPDETSALVVPWTSGGPVCQRGTIDQWAYAPGVVQPS